MDNKVKVYGVSFDLDSFEDVRTLTDLEELNPFPKLTDYSKREAESELFNKVYAYNYDVDRYKSDSKIMTKLDAPVKADAAPQL